MYKMSYKIKYYLQLLYFYLIQKSINIIESCREKYTTVDNSNDNILINDYILINDNGYDADNEDNED